MSQTNCRSPGLVILDVDPIRCNKKAHNRKMHKYFFYQNCLEKLLNCSDPTDDRLTIFVTFLKNCFVLFILRCFPNHQIKFKKLFLLVTFVQHWAAVDMETKLELSGCLMLRSWLFNASYMTIYLQSSDSTVSRSVASLVEHRVYEIFTMLFVVLFVFFWTKEKISSMAWGCVKMPF